MQGEKGEKRKRKRERVPVKELKIEYWRRTKDRKKERGDKDAWYERIRGKKVKEKCESIKRLDREKNRI